MTLTRNTLPGGVLFKFFGWWLTVLKYTLVNIQKAIENGRLWLIYPLKMVIFHHQNPNFDVFVPFSILFHFQTESHLSLQELQEMRRRAMAQDFSWSRAIDDYERHFDWTMAVSWRRCGRAVTS
jgi:ABC-type microcin C transport system permease subunit YejB